MRNNLSGKSDDELVEMLKGSKRESKEAFGELYDRYSGKLYTYCKKILNNSEIAEDVFQDTFERFYESARSGKLQISNISAYLTKIARNLCLNEKSRKANENVPIEDKEFSFYDESYENNEMANILHTALDTLPEQFKEVIVMKEFMDMTYQEIADALEVSMPLVRIRVFRAKNKLREVMSPYINDLGK